MNARPEDRSTLSASTASATHADASGARTRAEDALSQELIRFARMQHVIKARMGDQVPEGLDYAAVGVLMTLIKRGALRQGELAEAALLDPSTVSRHVGQLVRAGLVERRADPGDGRAVQLVATAAGRTLGDQLLERRRSLLERVLASWHEDELYQLVGLLGRLNDDFDGQRLLMVCHKPHKTDTPIDQEP